MPSSLIPAARRQPLVDLLSQVPDQRKERGRRHPLAGLLAVGIAAVTAGTRSFAAIGQRAADAGPDVLAGLGATRGPAGESTCRRTFAQVSADILDAVLGAWLWTRAAAAGGRLVIAVDGAAQVAQVRRTVTRKGKKTVEVVYVITSDADADAATLAAWIQEHWHIENKLHWVRDVTYQEDSSLVRRQAQN